LESKVRNIEVQSLNGLTAGKPRRDLKTLAGITLITASYLFCWPLIGLLGIVSAYLEEPLILSTGGPAVYSFSYVLLFAGIYLAGKKYVKHVFDWFKSLALRFVMVG